MNNDVIIVIPTHKLNFNTDELDSIYRCSTILSSYNIKMLIPDNIDNEHIENFSSQYLSIKIEKLPRSNFIDMKSYNNMCLQKWFYNMFKEYKYMLIYQTDGIVFYDNLKYWCSLDYDYIGAPWCYRCGINGCNGNKNNVGNGGVSLRKINTFIEKLPNNINIDYAEDVYINSMNLNIPTCVMARKFSIETGPYPVIDKNNIPMFGHKIYNYARSIINTIDNLIKGK